MHDDGAVARTLPGVARYASISGLLTVPVTLAKAGAPSPPRRCCTGNYYSSVDEQRVMSGIFALAGVTLGGVIVAASTAYSGRLADRRSLRDQRLARLRTAFAPLLRSARVLPYVVHRRKYLVEGESQETRDARLDEQFRETLQGVDEAEVALSLEATADVAVVRAVSGGQGPIRPLPGGDGVAPAGRGEADRIDRHRRKSRCRGAGTGDGYDRSPPHS